MSAPISWHGQESDPVCRFRPPGRRRLQRDLYGDPRGRFVYVTASHLFK